MHPRKKFFLRSQVPNKAFLSFKSINSQEKQIQLSNLNSAMESTLMIKLIKTGLKSLTKD
jgi:hypothetical protein